MEDNSPTTEQPKEQVEEVGSSNDENTNVIQESESKSSNEPTSTVGSEEDAVSPTTESQNQQDASKSTTEDKSLDEKPPSPCAEKLTSRLALWLEDHGFDQRIIDLIYWKDVKKTAVVFGTLLLILLFLVYHTVLSVVSFFALSVLTVSLLYRIGMTVIGAVQKTGAESPYKRLLEKDMGISKEEARDMGECVGNHINTVIAKLTKLFLVEDVFRSLKFGVFLWFLSCIGKWFNAITLLITGTLLLFSIPKLYEEHQVQVDQFLCKVCTKIKGIVQKMKSKVENRFQKKEKSA